VSAVEAPSSHLHPRQHSLQVDAPFLFLSSSLKIPLKATGFTKILLQCRYHLSVKRGQLGWFSANSLPQTDLTGHLPISKGNPEICAHV
jgi:hypothetical protein